MRALVTGGSGFIGSCLVRKLLAAGHDVRAPTRKEMDVCFPVELSRYVPFADAVYHLAGQIALTASVADPFGDFQANALGTLNVLEAARLADKPPVVLCVSSNKVYGPLDIELTEMLTRYRPTKSIEGVSEDWPLRPRSPYGCSKCAADLYAQSYAALYGVRTIVFRLSCVYGVDQGCDENHGWVGHLVKSVLGGYPFRIFGDGKQVRDLLWVDDACDAMIAAVQAIRTVGGGQVYNIGGGSENSISIWLELRELLAELFDCHGSPEFRRPRPGDQRWYVSDCRKALRDFGWEPKVGVREGLARLGGAR